MATLFHMTSVGGTVSRFILCKSVVLNLHNIHIRPVLLRLTSVNDRHNQLPVRDNVVPPRRKHRKDLISLVLCVARQ